MRLTYISFCILLSAISAAAQPAKPGSGPCALLTKAEVQEATGGTVSDGAVNSSNKTVCDFKIGDTGSVVGVMLTDKGSADSAEKMVAELKKRKVNSEVVSGFGDSAYRSSPGYGMQQIGVYKGSKHVIVTAMLMGSPEPKVKAITEKLMRKALARLP
jgi:hypothetical protein